MSHRHTEEVIGVLFLVLLAVPVAELVVIGQVADALGWVPTLILLIAVSVAGAALLKREGVEAWRRVQLVLRSGEVPAKEVTDVALILFGGALLLTPGFITDAVGLLFLIPTTRALVRQGAWRILRWIALRRFGVAGAVGQHVYDAPVVKTRRRDATRASQPLSPPRAAPSGAADSPDTE